MEIKDNTPHINVDYFENLTHDLPASEVPGVEAIGDKIKKLREDKGLSLDELSKITGFGVELLENIEKKEVQPQLGTIIKLSKALDSAFSRIVSGVGTKLFSITRKNERKAVSRSTSGSDKKPLYLYKSLAPEVQGRHMEALIVQLEEKRNEDPSVHEGEEFIYVLDGVVELKIGEDYFDLEPGDSVYYLSTTPHVISGKGGKANILAVVYGG
ncbi:MAG: helix-turn-helix transcriptional regulator [SAR324 cluster bacterium]|nr:helix-turn-helix transcriptional regulator [SAR324 cluster bacterium]